MKNEYKISHALREMAGAYTCANCLGRIARVDAADVTTLLSGMPGRHRIDVMIARCSRCGETARVFRLSDDRRGDSKASA
jgi:hypothetical protein